MRRRHIAVKKWPLMGVFRYEGHMASHICGILIYRCVLCVMLTCGIVHADIFNIGVLSFDMLIPSDSGVPGVNVFTVGNFTGDPGNGGFALTPDFPVFTALTLQNATLTVVSNLSTQVFKLGDIAPGSSSPAALEFPGTTDFSSASFSALLNQNTFMLSDGSAITASSSTVTADLLPASGPGLVAGRDIALIPTSNVPSVPEPQPTCVVVALLALIWVLKHKTLRRA
jgi:hypothetical protein